LDYYGRWKALHYAARRFFVPVLASAVVDGTSVSITGVNDRLVSVTARLEWTLARLDGAVVRRGGREVTLAPTSSRLLERIGFDEVAEPPGERTYRNDSFSRAGQFYFTYRLVSGGEELSANVAFFAPYKYLTLPQPDLQWQLAPSGRKVRIQARRFAAFVELSGAGDVHFTDNYFHMLPGESRTVAIRSTGDVKKIFARSLVDTTPISTVAVDGVVRN
jgi:beta-mannosidase